MGHEPVAQEKADKAQAPHPARSPLETVKHLRALHGTQTVVLDDDPTGSQSVHDLEVVFVPNGDAAVLGLEAGEGRAFVLTNSRAAEEKEAIRLSTEIAVATLRSAGAHPLQLVSRSDSTLRGHVIAEVGALDAARRRVGGRGHDAVLFVPAFPEAGRTTRAGVHYTRVGERELPVAESEFARDATFGFEKSYLPAFLEEVSAGAVRATDVLRIDLEDLRERGAMAVAEVLLSANGRWVVADAVEPADLDALAAGALLAESCGAAICYRTAPSFVRSLLGIEGLRVVDPDALRPWAHTGHGLVVVGSHTQTTTEQLLAARQRTRIELVELNVSDLLADPDATVNTVASRLADLLTHGAAILATSRELQRGATPAESLSIARQVSAGLAAVVARAVALQPPAWAVLKGGITSHDVAVHGLGVTRGRVIGQVFPGLISVVVPTAGAAAFRGCPIAIHPGNVGGPEALADVIELMQEACANA